MISTATKTLQANNKTIYVALLSTLTFFLFLDYIPGLQAWSAWVTPPVALFLGLIFALTCGQAHPKFNKKTSKYLLQYSVAVSYTHLYPTWDKKFKAASVISSSTPFSASIFCTPLICKSTICLISVSVNGKNIIVSSIRFRNSGRMVFFSIDVYKRQAYSDKLSHLHFHLAPKYVDGPDYGGIFQMNPGKVYLTDVEYQELIDAVKANL